MSTGFVPFPVRSVKPFALVVKQGDSVSGIAHAMTGDANRWTELVGANPQKALSSGNVAGSPYRVFASLSEGEKLMIPASWPNPGTVGDAVFGQYVNTAQAPGTAPSQKYVNTAQPCTPKTCSQLGISCGYAADGCGGIADCGACSLSAGTIDPLGTLITAVLTAYPGTVSTPQQYKVPDISQVIASWWPYLQTVNPQVFPPGTIPSIPVSPVEVSLWQQVIASAVEFLTQGKLPSGEVLAQIMKSIPWDMVPWDKIPWQQLGQELLDGMMRSQFWQMLINGTKVAPGKVSLSGIAPYKVDFLNKATWSTPPFSYVNQFGWQNVPWSSAGTGVDPINVWANISDPELLSCMQSNPARAADLAKYNAQCGFDKDFAKLKQYMCDDKLDPSKCASSPAVPNPIPGANINWGCSPSPQCIADQLKAAGLPAPCTPMPTCIPEWYKKVTGQGLPAAEEKKDENLPLKVGLAVAGAALVAGVVVIAASSD